MSDLQRLATSLEIKAVDASQRLITGHAAAIGNKDRTGDVIERGAFTRTLAENPDVLIFIGHDSSRLPVGEPVSMTEDTKGLLTTSHIYDTQAGDELLEVARRRMASGRTLGMSIGYRTVKHKFVGAVRHLQDVDLVEYSFLASPALAANPEAIVTSMKRRKAAGGTSTVADSYEDLQDDIREAACQKLNVQYCQVVATYTDHAIVCSGGNEVMGGDEESEYWDFPYTLGDDGEPILGDPKPVQAAFVAGKDDRESKPYRIEQRGDQYCVVGGASGGTVGCHPNRAEAMNHMRALYANVSDAKAVLDAAARNNLSSSDFAYIDSDGGKHLPIHDEAHVRAAMSRFSQTHFESPEKRSAAARKILARARSLGIDVSDGSDVANAAKGGPSLHDLDDAAFAYIEAGGMLDDEKKTFPRSLRHFPHHKSDGSIDLDLLQEALVEAAGHEVYIHLKRHALNAGIPFLSPAAHDDAHDPEWSHGAAPAVFAAASKLADLSEDIASGRRAMERLGLDTKDGDRLPPGTATRLKDIHAAIGQLLEWADAIERGEDGKLRVDMFRHRLAMLQLEEVS